MNDPDIYTRSLKIRLGITKVSELSSILSAEPSLKLPNGNATLLVYSYSDAKTKGFMPIIVNFTKTNIRSSALYVEIDETTGLVKSVRGSAADEPEWEFWPFG